MPYEFDICFNQEFKSIEEFEGWMNDILKQRKLHKVYTADSLGVRICQHSEIFQAICANPTVKIALLKTICLEIIEDLRQEQDSEKEANRRNFEQAIQSLFSKDNPDSRIFCASITRQLRQFKLGRTYDSQEIITEAYTRGITLIDSGKSIDNPLGWLRRTCINVIRELKREQLTASKPKFDRQPWTDGGIVYSEVMVQEDHLAIQAAAKQLSSEEQLLLELRVIQDLSWKEVGEHLVDTDGQPLKEGTARQRGARVFEKLRILYDEIRQDIKVLDDSP
jgi:DNA-directed RNA polymerase specialized sigma24 family protein